MKANLSKLIKLDRIPSKYYSPKNELEKVALCRDENVYLEIFDSPDEGADAEVRRIIDIINTTVEVKGKCVLALGAGNATHIVYEHLIEAYREGRVSFRNVIVFNISEFYPIYEEGPSTLTLSLIHI